MASYKGGGGGGGVYVYLGWGLLVGFTESFYQREKLRRIEGKSRKLRQGENDNVGCQLIQKRVKDELINMPRRRASESEGGREMEIGKASAQNFHKAGAKRCCKQLMRATGRKVETAKLKIKNKLETLSNAALTPSYPQPCNRPTSPSPLAHHLPVMSVRAMTMTLIMTERMETTKAQTEQNENVGNGKGDEETEKERKKNFSNLH